MSGIHRVIAGVSGSPGSLPALRYAADLARSHDATLIPVLAWIPPGGDLAERSHPSPYLRRIWTDAAWQWLWAAVDTALGGIPADLCTEPAVRRGEAGLVLADAACQPGDLLVIGAGRRGTLSRLWHGKVSRYCLAHACCPVIAVPPPTLEPEAGHGLRGWAFRHRQLTADQVG
ncbi:MAG: universal stress protein [Streptosporangiaceae bacterium]